MNLQAETGEFIIRLHDFEGKRQTELMRNFAEFYAAQLAYHEQAYQVLQGLDGYVKQVISGTLEAKNQFQEERRQLEEIRAAILADGAARIGEPVDGAEKRAVSVQTETKELSREGFLLKRSDGLVKNWQKRYCTIANGVFRIAHNKVCVDSNADRS